MDRWGLFFGWVGLVSLLFAIPLAETANLITPRIQRWWSHTTKTRRERRIKSLQTQLQEREAALTNERYIRWSKMQGVRLLISAAWWFSNGFYQLATILFIYNRWPHWLMGTLDDYVVHGVICIWSVFCGLSFAVAMARLNIFKQTYVKWWSTDAIKANMEQIELELSSLGVDNSH